MAKSEARGVYLEMALIKKRVKYFPMKILSHIMSLLIKLSFLSGKGEMYGLCTASLDIPDN